MIDFEQLKNRLQQELPGETAHREMLSERRAKGIIKFKKRAQPRMCGVLLLLYPHQDNWFLPFIQRPNYEGVQNHGGQIAFPGGGEEQDDSSRLHTALRETQEEIGVIVQEQQVIGQLSEIYIAPSDSYVIPYIAIHDERPSFMPDPKEVAELHEFSIQTFLNNNNRKVKRDKFGGDTEWEVPYFDAQGHVIWGATAMMLNEFLHILR